MNDTHWHLRTGEDLTIRLLEPPLGEEWAKIEYWWTAIRERLFAGALAEHSLDRFFVAELEGEYAGSMTLGMPRDTRDVGILGMVWTAPAQRRKGIAAVLIRALLASFLADGGEAIHLCTTNPAAFDLYRKAGFEPYTGDGLAYFRSGRAAFEAPYLTPAGPAQVRAAHWGDLARVAFLYNLAQPDWLIKDYPRRIWRDTRFERHFLEIMLKAEQAKGAFLVLESPARRIVGTAQLTEIDSFYEQHVKTLDFRVCPAYQAQGPELLAAIVEQARGLHTEVLQAYAAASDEGKAALLRGAGFTPTATLPGHLAAGDRRIDLVIYTRRIAERAELIRQPGDYYGGRPAFVS